MKKPTHAFFSKLCASLALIAAPLAAGAQTPSAGAAPSPQSAPVAVPSAEQAGYLIGLSFGQQMHQVGITNEVPVAEIDRGLKAGLAGAKSTPADQQGLQAFIHSIMEATLTRNKTAAKDFLARNAKEKGVKTTASGLQYKIVEAGDTKAAAPSSTDEVTVQYRGKLLDGTEFDSSYSRGAPATFPIDRVIKGWQEALVMMKPGAKWKLFIPPELAYDTSPRPGIPPGSIVDFRREFARR